MGYSRNPHSNLKDPDMTPLRRRFIEDMQLRGLAPTTQRSYLHYVTEYSRFYNTSPAKLDLEAIRQYELYLLNERKLSPESVNILFPPFSFSTQKRSICPGAKNVFRACASPKSCR